MSHQKLHLIRQNATVAQNEVLPKAGFVGRIKEGHLRLFRRAMALTVVAGAACGHHVHPSINAILSKRHYVLAGKVFFVEMTTAVGADIAVTGKQLAIGQARAQIKGIDVGHAPGANNAVDPDDGLKARYGVVSAMEHSHLAAGFPTHFSSRIVGDRLLQRDPGLGQPLG